MKNLQFVLGFSAFPTAPVKSGHSQDLIHEGDCCICFTARLDGNLPSRACNNEKCGMMYHGVCLFEVCITENFIVTTETSFFQSTLYNLFYKH